MRHDSPASRTAGAVLGVILLTAALAAQSPPRGRFVDDAGRTVQLPAQVTRVFAAGAPADVLLYTLVPDKLPGRNRVPAADVLDFHPPAYRTPVLIRQLPDRDDASADAELLALKPSIYIDYGSVHEDYAASVAAIQKRTGIPGIILDGRLDRIPSVYRRLGPALGAAARGEHLSAASERILTTYRGALTTAKVRVYMACSSDGFVPCLADDTAAEQLALLGAINVAGTAAAAPRRPRTIDEIRAMVPDVIVMTGQGAAARLRANPEWQTVDAVARGRVLQFPGIPDSWGSRPPSVNRLAGVIWLARALPNRPLDAAFRDEVRAFYSTFYHVDLTDQQLQRLLPQ